MSAEKDLTAPVVSKCRSCGAAIYWCITHAGKRMPVDVEPTPDGDFELYRKTDGSLKASKAPQLGAQPKLRKSHFATCPQASQHRKPRQGDLNV